MDNDNLLDEQIFSLLKENNFFHDFYVEKISFSLLGNKFRLVLSSIDPDYIFTISMKRMFSFTYTIDFLVCEEEYDNLSWNRLFKFMRFRHLLGIDIKESKYTSLSVKYFNKKSLKLTLDFDCGFMLELDCLDMIIEKKYSPVDPRVSVTDPS